MAEPLNYKSGLSFYIIIYCTSREEKSGWRHFGRLRHDRDLQWRQKMIYLFNLWARSTAKWRSKTLHKAIMEIHQTKSEEKCSFLHAFLTSATSFRIKLHSLSLTPLFFVSNLSLWFLSYWKQNIMSAETGRTSSFSEGKETPPWDRSRKRTWEITHLVILWG